MPDRILVVDDELSIRQVLQILLEGDGYEVRVAGTAEEAARLLTDWWPDLVLTDLNLPGEDGIWLLRQVKSQAARRKRDAEVVVLTAYATTESAVEAMQIGAADYVTKPFNNDELRLVIRKALGRQELEAEVARLKAAVQGEYHFGNMVGSSSAMNEVYEMIRRVKDSRINCLIEGESGSGKEMVARALHYSGIRADGPFVAVNCGAISENLVESELFGHKKGAFTGAVQDKVGLMQAADKGTLFLDEVVSLPASAQVGLLRAIQERRFMPVGDVREVEVDVRLIVASNVRLEDAVQDGTFREDLFYRLNVVQIGLPALRERRDDVPELARHFVELFASEYKKDLVGLDPAAVRLLQSWHYPGNVRELRNIMERAVALCQGPLVQAEDLPERLGGAPAVPVSSAKTDFPPDGINLDAILAEAERGWLMAALQMAEGNKTRAAQLVQLSFRQFRYRLAKLGIELD